MIVPHNLMQTFLVVLDHFVVLIRCATISSHIRCANLQPVVSSIVFVIIAVNDIFLRRLSTFARVRKRIGKLNSKKTEF